ncbi:aspartate aminotransferase family protein [Pseudoxanthobacter sp. M-2]|uniref:aspartate aminotransferase family protein n=1 Tax=Pseudoxanthobacter sp. M-2 TaxID=3078754 RepID=UPI0038FC878B
MDTPVVRNSTAAWKRADGDHHIHPFTDNEALRRKGGPRIIVKASGSVMVDSEGNRIIDAMSGLWCVNVGYGREELARAAYDQMSELAFYNTFFKTTTPPPVELAEKLATLTPGDLNRFFFACSGSEANDTILRFVKRYWNLMGKPAKKTVISRINAYHGSTTASASLGGMSTMHEMDDLPIAGIEHVIQPYWYTGGGDLSEEEFGLVAARAVEDKILELGPENVAAFFGEPLQGSGGAILPPSNYWPEINRICRKYDILLVADEVICGFGRTGEWFGSTTFGIEPDIMTMAKGITSGYLPLSAVAVSDRVADVLYAKGGDLSHGYTYSGHPTACAVALANIAIIEREGLVERVRDDIGPYFQTRLRDAVADHPLVGNIRGIGLVAGLAIVEDKATRTFRTPVGTLAGRCHEICVEMGAMIRVSGDSMVMAPPLVITKEEVDTLMVIYRAALDKTAAEFGLV